MKTETIVNGITIPIPESTAEATELLGVDGLLHIVSGGLVRAYEAKARQLVKSGSSVEQVQDMFDSKSWVPPGRKKTAKVTKALKAYFSMSDQEKADWAKAVKAEIVKPSNKP